jgi:ferredoxin-NADP reductase
MQSIPSLIVPPIGAWQQATVTDIHAETPHVKTFSLQLEKPTVHLAGQHFVVRLTAPDGYTAQRSYSVASPPGDGRSIDLTVERLADGEVSTFLHDEVRIGDTLEVRGPIGGWFVWDATSPALLIGGGSGVVPLMSMLRLARREPGQSLAHLLVSVRDPTALIYANEMSGSDVSVIFSRTAPPDSGRLPGRLAAHDLTPHIRRDATIYICGSAGFTAAVSELVAQAGVDPRSMRIERFGPTGSP